MATIPSNPIFDVFLQDVRSKRAHQRNLELQERSQVFGAAESKKARGLQELLAQRGEEGATARQEAALTQAQTQFEASHEVKQRYVTAQEEQLKFSRTNSDRIYAETQRNNDTLIQTQVGEGRLEVNPTGVGGVEDSQGVSYIARDPVERSREQATLAAEANTKLLQSSAAVERTRNQAEKNAVLELLGPVFAGNPEIMGMLKGAQGVNDITSDAIFGAVQAISRRDETLEMLQRGQDEAMTKWMALQDTTGEDAAKLMGRFELLQGMRERYLTAGNPAASARVAQEASMKSQRLQSLTQIVTDPKVWALPTGSPAQRVLLQDRLAAAQTAGRIPPGFMPSLQVAGIELQDKFNPLGLDKTITNPNVTLAQAEQIAASRMNAPPTPAVVNPVGEVQPPPDEPTDADLPGFQGTVEQGEALGRSVMQGEDGVSIAAALYPNLDPTSRKEAVRRNMSSIKGKLQSVSKGEFNNARVNNAMRRLREYLASNK
jgi:hypothetical protein